MNIKFKYNDDKNLKLEIERGVNFEDIIEALNNDGLLDIVPHHNREKYPGQKMIHVIYKDEVYAVPCVEEEEGVFFMKTLFPSRKARKKFLEKPKEPK